MPPDERILMLGANRRNVLVLGATAASPQGVDDDKDLCENQEVPLSSVQHDQAGLASQRALMLQRLVDGRQRPSKPVAAPPSGITVRFSTDTKRS